MAGNGWNPHRGLAACFDRIASARAGQMRNDVTEIIIERLDDNRAETKTATQTDETNVPRSFDLICCVRRQSVLLFCDNVPAADDPARDAEKLCDVGLARL